MIFMIWQYFDEKRKIFLNMVILEDVDNYLFFLSHNLNGTCPYNISLCHACPSSLIHFNFILFLTNTFF
jgi:hypothetical protein